MPSFGKKTVRKVKWISALQWAYAFDAVELICNQFLIGNVQFVIDNSTITHYQLSIKSQPMTRLYSSYTSSTSCYF